MQILPHLDAAERWMQVPGRDGIYEVSNCGRVRSRERTVRYRDGRRRRYPGELVATNPDKVDGYVRVSLRCMGKQEKCYLHTLVLTAFIGPAAEGEECCHRDGDRANNRLDNLRWGTPKENAADKLKHGTQPRGEQAPNAVLTEAIVRKIRDEVSKGQSKRSTARRLGVRYGTLMAVVSGRTWTHVGA